MSMHSSVSQRVVTATTVPPQKSAEASASASEKGKLLNRKPVALSVLLYDMEESEIRELYDDSEKPFYYNRGRFSYRNKAQLRLDQEIEKAMAEYNERCQNLSVFDAIAPPRIAGLCGSVLPLIITDNKRTLLIRLCNLALEDYNAQNQGENFVFDNLVKSTFRSVARGVMYYITFQAKAGGTTETFQAQVCDRVPEEGPPVIKSCSLKPT